MYNSEIKCRYIEKKESTTGMPDGYLKRQFDKIEIFERRLDKDLCNFTVYEIIDVYKNVETAIKGVPVEYVRRAVALVERYTDKAEFSKEIFCNDIESLYNEVSLKLK